MIKKIEKEVKEDRYGTASMPISQKLIFYEKKLAELKRIRSEHKAELANLKTIKTTSMNLLQFKQDEMSKKMNNEIARLSQEELRHEESQVNESKKIHSHIAYLKEHNEMMTKVLDEFLERVITLEKTLGPLN